MKKLGIIKNECFDTRKDMTDVANFFVEQFGFEMVRCRLHCEKIEANRSAILLLYGNVVKRRFLRCKACKNKEGATK